jgi:hypothetical protein
MLRTRHNAPKLCRPSVDSGFQYCLAAQMAETPFEPSFRQSRSMPGRSSSLGPFGRELPNEAVNLLKIKIAHFPKSLKAVNLLKISR